jgi:phosphopantetheinyl transferase
MNSVPLINYKWPEMPPLPPPAQPVLIRVVTTLPRRTARRELRTVLRRVLAAWSNRSPEQLPLRETARGPVWQGQLDGRHLDISVSYAEGEGWIGLIRAGWIGVDAMRIRHIPEAEEVARHYLDKTAVAAIRRSPDPAMAFTAAWTELEARLKCMKRELKEWSVTQQLAIKKCTIQSIVLPGRLMVTVATARK